MIKKRGGIAIACALLTALALVLPAFAAEAKQRAAPVMMILRDEGEHIQYMKGSDGKFNPEQPVSRAELAQMLARIVADEPTDGPWFYDVSADAWYAPAVAKVTGLGLMRGEDGWFRPNDPATRAECAYALALLLPYSAQGYVIFPDVRLGYWAYDAIARTAGCGLFAGDPEGNFRPESSLKRCEAVTVFNRLLGRSPDLDYIQTRDDLRTFSDVPTNHWAYGDIMEATVTHQCAASWTGAERWIYAVSEPSAPTLADGPQRIDGRLYWVVDGAFVKNQSIGEFQFDADGRYTTGNGELDTLLNDIVERQTNDSMTRDQKLRALFDYVVKNYRYLARPMVAKGATGWEPEYALYFLKNGKGNCFSFAAAYCLLCRELGLPAYTWLGANGKATSPHGWVEIPLDGAAYMFDPELQWYYNNRTSTKVDLFKMLPTNIPAGVYRYFR